MKRLFARFFASKQKTDLTPARLNPEGPEGQPRNEAQMTTLEQALGNIEVRVQEARDKTQEAYVANIAVFDAFEAMIKQRRKELGHKEAGDVPDSRKNK